MKQWYVLYIFLHSSTNTLKYYPNLLERLHIFSCDQAALWMVQSVCLSVCLSHYFDYVPIIISSWNFQELLPMREVMSMQKITDKGQRSQRSKLSRFRTLTHVIIHIWWWNDAQSLVLLKRGALLIFKVIRQNFNVTRLKQIVDFDPNWAFPDCNTSFNSPMALKLCTKLEVV